MKEKNIFRRNARANSYITSDLSNPTAIDNAVATIDSLAKRMDMILGDDTSIVAPPMATTPSPTQLPIAVQQAAIASANDRAASIPVQNVLEHDHIDEIKDLHIVTPAEKAPIKEIIEPTEEAVTSAAKTIGIDMNRVVRMIEEIASGVHHQIELKTRAANVRTEEIINRAEVEADQIREQGQLEARGLLSEVEDIISEAQQTGKQILFEASEEATKLRGESTTIISQAQAEARSIVETARREGEQILAEQRRLATVRAQEAMREQDRLKDQIRRLEERRRQVLESLEPLISQLTQMMPLTQK